MARKSLGTLTLDIVARTGGFIQGMDQAERRSEQWRKQVDRDLKTIRGGIDKTLKVGAAAVAAATAATVALTKQGMDAVRSQADLARSLDTTYDSITALQLAAGDVGLEGLEGSLTRLNRRLGAAEVGSGAAANAVKELQLDLQALSEMDVDERVATIADAIRDSGVSMQRAARFAQDLGFEQRQAAEFFFQGGDAIRAYRERVEALGLSLSDIDAQKVVDAQNAMGIFGDLTRGASQILAVQFSPIIQQVATDLENAAIESGGLSDNIGEMVDTAVQGVAFVVSSVDGVGRVFSALGKSAAVVFLRLQLSAYRTGDSFVNGPIEAANELIDLLNIIPGIDIEPRALSGIGSKIKAEIAILEGAIDEGLRDIQDGLLDPLAGERLIKYYNDAKTAAEGAARAAVDLKEANQAVADVLEDPSAKRARESAEKARIEGIAREISALERAAATWGMTADQVKIYGLQTQGATEAQLAHAQSLIDTVSGLEKAKKEQEDYLRLVQDLRTDEEKLTDQMRERLAVLDAIKNITDDERNKIASRIASSAFSSAPEFGGLAPEIGGPFGELSKIDDAQKELQNWYDTQLEMLNKYRTERSDLNAQWDEQEANLKREHEERLANIERARTAAQLSAAESAFSSLSEMAKQFAGEQSKTYRALFAIEKAVAIARAIVAINTGLAQAAANPWPTNLAAIASVAAATAGIVSTIASTNISGQAHDGIMSIPEDGTWNLKKGERVTTAETSAKLDATLDRINRGGGNNSGVVVNLMESKERAGRVEEERGPNNEEIINIWVADLMGDGKTATAIQRKFQGMRAAGR